MRDKCFVSEHRGGFLTKELHHELMSWAYCCVEHVLFLFGDEIDERLVKALAIAKDWIQGNASIGDCRKASLGAIATANDSSCPVAIAVARSVGHVVATAHMAEHSLRATWYALKAVKAAGQSVAAERKWQDNQLSSEIRELVLAVRIIKKI